MHQIECIFITNVFRDGNALKKQGENEKGQQNEELRLAESKNHT